MGKLLKISAWLAGLLVLLVVAAVVILPMVIDPNDYKAQIVDKVQQETGRTLSIDGDLKLSVFPWLGMEINGLGLSNAEGFGKQPFAQIRQAAVRVKLLPLISQRLEVDTIGLDGLELNLARRQDGVTNWDDLVGKQPAEEKPAPSEDSGRRGGLAGLSIGGIDINEARVTWDDRDAGQRFQIDSFNLKTGTVAPGKPVDLKLSMALQSSEPPVTAQVGLKAVVTVDEGAGILEVGDLDMVVDGQGEALPGGAARAELQAGLKMGLDGESLEVSGLKLSADSLKLDADLKARALGTRPMISGTLQLAEFDLRQWLLDHGIALPEMSDDKALTLVGASATLTGEGDTMRIEPLALRLDDTRVTGSASLKGPAVGFSLALDAIDVDRYLPAEKAQSDTPKGAPAPAATGDEPLFPIETLRALDLDGVIDIGQLTVKKLLAEQVQVRIKAKQGRLEIGQQIKKFYQGDYQGQVKLDVSGKSPHTQVETAVGSIQVGPLLKDLSGQDRVSGKGRFKANLDSRGNSINAIKRALDGNLEFRFEDGAVKGFNLGQMIREAKARFKGEALPQSSQPQQTDFSEMSGSAIIDNGVLSNQDLLAKSPFLRVDGKGKVNLVDETLDYTVKAVIVSTDKGQGGEGLDELKGIPVPVHLTGPLASPGFNINWGEVLVDTQKAKLEEKTQKLEQKLQNKIEDKLKGLFR